MNKQLLVGLALTLSLIACNKNDEKKDLSYDLTENGCPTGKISYSSTDDLCNKLKDDKVNNFCARSLRYNMFKDQCAGKSWN